MTSCGTLQTDLFRQFFRLLVHDPVEKRRLVFATEGEPAGKHLVEDHAEREDIGAAVGLQPLGLLRRHVRSGPESCTLSGKP